MYNLSCVKTECLFHCGEGLSRQLKNITSVGLYCSDNERSFVTRWFRLAGALAGREANRRFCADVDVVLGEGVPRRRGVLVGGERVVVPRRGVVVVVAVAVPAVVAEAAPRPRLLGR